MEIVNREGLRRILWLATAGLLAFWLWFMGGWGALGCWSGLTDCAATWTDEWGTHVRRPVNIGGPPVRMIEVAKEDIIKVKCSGSASIFLGRVTSGNRREKSGCAGIKDAIPNEVASRALQLGLDFDIRVWPQPNVPMLGAICRVVPYGDPFRQESQWLEPKWSYIWARGLWQSLKGGGDTHDSLYINASGWLYCWANAPIDINIGRPDGTFWFEVEN